MRRILEQANLSIHSIVSSSFHTNTYILISGKDALIVDPGFDVYNEHKIGNVVNFLTKNNVKNVYILNTHGHLDHVCGNTKLRKALTKLGINCRIAIHKLDAYLLKDFNEHLAIGTIVPPYTLRVFNLEPHDPDVLLDDEQIIEIGDVKCRVIHCPGHTRGSIVVYCEDVKILFSGDVILDGGIGRVDLPHSSPVDMYRSITKLLAELDFDTLVLPGHGNTFKLSEQADQILQETMWLVQS